MLKVAPYFGRGGEFQGYDIFLDDVWLGSRRTLNQISRYMRFYSNYLRGRQNDYFSGNPRVS